MTAYRITNRSIHRTVMNGLQDNLGRMQRLQEQLSSGKQVSKPSDSPVGTSSAMRYRAQVRSTEQHVRNAQDGLSWLAITDDTLTGVISSAGRARQLILQGINATSSASEREALAAEVDSLRSGLLDAANTTYLDRPIFAGTANVDVAYDRETGEYLGNVGDETAPGAAGKVERTVAPGVTARVNLTGPEIFGAANDAANPDLFAVLDQVAADLRAGDVAGLESGLVALDEGLGAVQNQLAKVGARYNQLETMQNRAENDLIDLSNGLAEVENIDLPRTIVDLQLQEVAYKSALSATARVIQPSLLDFLR